MTDTTGSTNLTGIGTNLTSGKRRKGDVTSVQGAGSLNPTLTNTSYSTTSTSSTSASVLAGGVTSSQNASFTVDAFAGNVTDDFIIPEGEWLVDSLEVSPGTTAVINQSLRRFWHAQYPMMDDGFAFKYGNTSYGGYSPDGSFNPEIPPLTGSEYSNIPTARGITRGNLVLPTEFEKGYKMRAPSSIILTPRLFVPTTFYPPGDRDLEYPTPHQIACSVLENYKIIVPYQAIGLNFLAITRLSIQTPEFEINAFEGPALDTIYARFGEQGGEYLNNVYLNMQSEYLQFQSMLAQVSQYNIYGMASQFGNLADHLIEMGEVEYCISGPLCKEITTGVWEALTQHLLAPIDNGQETLVCPRLPVYDDPITAKGWNGVYNPQKLSQYWDNRLLYGEGGTASNVNKENIGLQWQVPAATGNSFADQPHGGPIGSANVPSNRPPTAIGHPRLPNGRQVGRVTSWKPFGTIAQLKEYSSPTGFVCGPGTRKDIHGNVFRKAVALRHRYPEMAPGKDGVYGINNIHMTGHITVRGNTYA